jgi:formamidopyrimidine-DNA glycosylase
MPELPEVETFRRNLLNGTGEHPSLVGMRITGVDLLWERTLEKPPRKEFEDRIIDQTIQDFGRRGKYLLIHLSEDTLIIHLRMSGDLIFQNPEDPIGKHDRLILSLDSGLRLAFNDTRKFGRVWLLREPESILGKLGPEPLDAGFTPEGLHTRLKSKSRQIKPLLLDQTFLAGMGNIYTDEALHIAKIHPLINANTLIPEQSKELWKAIRQVLEEGIRRNGSSIDWVYRGGDFQNYFQVYQRTGEPCYYCGTPIERMVVGQRSTHFCPKCQPAPET